MSELLRQFLEEDCSAGIRKKLLQEMTAPSGQKREFTFNRFNVAIDHQSGEVTITDELEPGPEGECKLPSIAFVRALQMARS